MKTINTADATDAALDWLVAEALGQDYYQPETGPSEPDFSTDWSQGGPIIEREIAKGMFISGGVGWGRACYGDCDEHGAFDRFVHVADTPLIAAMRCFVASKLGDTVEVPEELL